MPIKEVRYSIRKNTSGRARCRVSWGVHIAKLESPKVSAHGADKNPSITALEAINGHASRLNCFIYGLHEHSMLGIYSLCFNGLNAEELSVKGGHFAINLYE